jgi:hypothetical protein
MKTVYTVLFCLQAVIFAASCTDRFTEERDVNYPVYMSYETMRSSVRSAGARSLVNPGKIYFKDSYILVVEYLEGVHLIDISDPANPQNRVFIEVPGCMDIAVKDRSLYADSYVDLVVIDLSDPASPKETERLKNVFPYTVPTPEHTEFPYAGVDKTKGIVIDWEVKREKRKLEQQPYQDNQIIALRDTDYATAFTNSSSSVSFGKSGSMARFGLYDDYLYIANSSSLYLINASNAGEPFLSNRYGIGNVETLFIYDSHLFFGTPSGMTVYGLETPWEPQYKGSFWHVNSCDPVVIQDGYAYITLRGGTDCYNAPTSRLDIVECLDGYTSFTLVGSYTLTEPYGLGIDGSTLFVCDGKDGLKVYDVTDKQAVSKHLLASFPAIQAYDVIPVNGYLFMIGDDGFYLYDYSDIQNIRLTGHIPVESGESKTER